MACGLYFNNTLILEGEGKEGEEDKKPPRGGADPSREVRDIGAGSGRGLFGNRCFTGVEEGKGINPSWLPLLCHSVSSQGLRTLHGLGNHFKLIEWFLSKKISRREHE